MKQLLSLFLFLLPCLACAQYPSNGNQKITLGEQTSADGLVYRGVLGDTLLITPSSDTSAYIILDTVNHRFYNYNRATNVWSMAGVGSISSGLTGVLPVANGGTNTSTAFTAGSVVFAGSGGTYSQDNSGLFFDATNNRLGVNIANPLDKFHIDLSGTEGFSASKTGIPLDSAGFKIINGTGAAGIFQPRFEFTNNNSGSSVGGQFSARINNTQIADVGIFLEARKRVTANQAAGPLTIGNVLRIGTFNVPLVSVNYRGDMILMDGLTTTAVHPSEKLHVVGNARITAMNGIGDIGADANGVLQAATSDMNLKNTIENSPFGLNEILLLNPVTFLYNDKDRKIDSDVKEVGFIAQDVFDVIPNAVSSTGTGDLQLDYRAITATLVKAIQEQNFLIKALEQRIINLENK
jgi:hypothetical protein